MRAVKVFTSSALASGSNKTRIQRAEHMLQLGGLAEVRKAIAVTRLGRPCLVSAGGHGTWECVLHHVRLCWLSLRGTQLRKQSHEAIKTPASRQSQVFSVTSTAKSFVFFRFFHILKDVAVVCCQLKAQPSPWLCQETYFLTDFSFYTVYIHAQTTSHQVRVKMFSVHLANPWRMRYSPQLHTILHPFPGSHWAKGFFPFPLLPVCISHCVAFSHSVSPSFSLSVDILVQ